MRKALVALGVSLLTLAALSFIVEAHAPSGAIFTTLADGSEVNFNIYPTKESVYLDGGPGPGAPQGAAGLDNGTYVFQVTDPSGKQLLSEDPPRCRQLTVLNGVITAVVPTLPAPGCQHATGLDIDHGVTTVQLMPYKNTPNPGGVYKAWVTRIEDFGCAITVANCNASGTKFGFNPGHTKTDNFKVRDPGDIREIDTRFFADANNNGHKDDNEPWLDGLAVKWIDPLGASNKKHSYWAPHLNVYHEAHVEAIENGIHKIEVANQPGCTVGLVHLRDIDQAVGPQVVSVEVTSKMHSITIFIDVACVPTP